jgi:hypothetical protein
MHCGLWEGGWPCHCRRNTRPRQPSYTYSVPLPPCAWPQQLLLNNPKQIPHFHPADSYEVPYALFPKTLSLLTFPGLPALAASCPGVPGLLPTAHGVCSSTPCSPARAAVCLLEEPWLHPGHSILLVLLTYYPRMRCAYNHRTCLELRGMRMS